MALPLIGAAPPVTLDIAVEGLRAERGDILLCLFHDKGDFPDCSHNTHARKASAPARNGMTIRIEGLATGRYAVTLIHDENGNRKLDTSLGIPREGVGFSRNPKFFFGPPRYDAAAFDADAPEIRQSVKVRYFL